MTAVCNPFPNIPAISAGLADGVGVKSGGGALFHTNSALTSGQAAKRDFTRGRARVRVGVFPTPTVLKCVLHALV